MKVVAGHREMLQCSSSSPINVVKMEWLVNDTVDVYLFRNGKTCNDNQNEKYKGKTSIFEDKVSQGNFSLILTAEMSHSGKYRCAVYDGRNTIECYINVSGKYSVALFHYNKKYYKQLNGLSDAHC